MVRLLILILCGLLACVAEAEEWPPEMRAVAQRCRQIDEQLGRAVVYRQEVAPGEVQEAWLTEGRDPLKLAVTKKEAQRLAHSEFYFDQNGENLFTVHRTETPLAGGETQVDEERKYFAKGALFRVLTKSGRFPPGASLDTVHIKNVVQAGENPRMAEYTQDFTAATTGAPVHDPAGDGTGDSAKFRVMQHATTRDGRYALAWGPGKAKFDWKEYGENGDYGDLDIAEEARGGDAHTYVVDLTTHRIIGETGAAYSGTGQYNHRRQEVAWSENGRYVAQATSWKWYSDHFRAGYIDAQGHYLAAPDDLRKLAGKAAQRFLQAKHDPTLAHHSLDDLAQTVSNLSVSDAGILTFVFGGEVPKADEKDSSFEVTEQFRLVPAGTALKVVPLSVAYGAR